MCDIPTKRIVQFELLRILAMCGVVMNHVFNDGLHIYDNFSIDVSIPHGAILWGILELIKLIVLPSVNCYILITGYFLIDKTSFRWRGVWRVWSETWFYSVGIYLFSVALCMTPFSWNDLLEHATPIISNTYWFVTSYLSLILIAPLLARLMMSVSKLQYQMVLVIGAVICFQLFLGQFLMDQQQILLFVYLFLIGGYIRRYHREENYSSRYPIIAFGCILALMFAYTLIKNIYVGNSTFVIYSMAYHGLVLPLSVALFLWVKNWKVQRNKIRRMIYSIAPLSFAVYIIHTHPQVSNFLWDIVTQLLSSANKFLLPILVVVITLAVFLFGIFIDFFRARIIKRIKDRF